MLENLKLPNVDRITIERAHRMPAVKKPNPIIVKFQSLNDRDRVWAVKHMLRNTKVIMTEDYPKEYVDRRRILLPIMHRAKELGHQASVKQDKLIIDDKVYNTKTLNTLPTALQPSSVATRKIDDTLCFFGGSSPLSNFFQCDLSIDGRSYSSVEQFFQYSKANFAECLGKASDILKATSPAACKSIGDSVEVDVAKWMSEAPEIMLKGCRAKFHQNQYAKQFLLSTEQLKLAEASYNKQWGIGVPLNHKNITEKDTWVGKNLLGKILVKVRGEVK